MSKALWGLEKLDLFDNLNPMELQEITKISNKVFFHKGDIITDKDDKSRNVYVLIEGNVEIFSLKGVPLYRVSKGEIFGELAILSTIQRSAVAVAREESWVIVINMNHLEHLGEEHPNIYTKVTKNLVLGLGVKLARANKLIELLKEELMKAIKK
jgi:CRP/FNR family transcriptional regulator, cyclic AMP receptor protein